MQFGQVPPPADVRGVPLGTACTLKDSRLNPAGIAMTWIPARGRYEGSGNGLVYYLDRSGPSESWAISLAVPAITSHGIYDRPVDPAGVSPLRWRGFVPSSGPF